MKRKDIISTIETAGQLMDSFGGCMARNDDTNETIADLVTEEEIRARQTTLYVCKDLLSKDTESCSPLNLVGKIIGLHGIMKLEGAEGEDNEAEEEATDGDAND